MTLYRFCAVAAEPSSARSVAIVMPAQHLLDAAGAARVFEHQARVLQAAGWRVLAVAVAPSLFGRAQPNSHGATRSALAKLSDDCVIVSATRGPASPRLLMHAFNARLQRRWPLAADLAVSQYVDASDLRERSVHAVVCNYLQTLSAADALASLERQILVLHDLDPGPVPAWLIPIARARGAVAALNRQEAERLEAAGAPCATLAPIFSPAASLSDAERDDAIDLLFVGGAHPPNVEGLRAFIRDCFAPHLAPRGVRMVVAGAAGPLAINGTSSANIDCIGHVDDPTPLYHRARLVVSPLLQGSGTSIKIAEALATGKPVLGTPVAWRGYDIDTDAALPAPFDKRWAERIVGLLNDKSARQSLFAAGARAVRTSGAALPDLVASVARP